MSDPVLLRFQHPEGSARVGVRIEDTIYDVTGQVGSVAEWLKGSVRRVSAAIAELESAAQAASTSYSASDSSLMLLPPVDEQEVWAAGVTYEISRNARQEEAQDGGDVYARVYNAQRPELFFKAQGWRVVGPNAEVGIRSDASWSVPEPELAVAFNPALEVVGFTVGNDMSSRDIEGANPLYLPQAKLYTASCALGPGIVLNPSSEWPDAAIRITIGRGGAKAFEGQSHTSRIVRNIGELAQYLGHSYTFPNGVVLLTGTGTVPPSDFTLAAGDVITVDIEGVGQIANTVKVV